LADLLDKAGVKSGAVDVSFQGLDRPVLPQTPAFIKSLKLEKARDKDVIVAYAMNDQPMPMLNGFPIRLIVPGWYATYWVKSLNEINVLNEPFKGFWMDKAYRIANNPHASEQPDKLAADTVPINTMTVRSLIVSPESGDHVPAGKSGRSPGRRVRWRQGHRQSRNLRRRWKHLEGRESRPQLARQLFVASAFATPGLPLRLGRPG